MRQYHGVCKIYSARWLSGIDDGSGAVRAYRKPKEVVTVAPKDFVTVAPKDFVTGAPIAIQMIIR